jgi:hypothetical protein
MEKVRTKNNRRGKYDQSILYKCMKLSQYKLHIVQLICANKDLEKIIKK